LAGSSVETDTCVAQAMSLAGVTLPHAIDMAGRNASRLLGFEEIALTRGSRADLIVFRAPQAADCLDILATVAAGTIRFGTLD
jgi:N-acetylglucosamine-6-phosphate deacetylase